MKIKISDIQTDAGTQTRIAIHEETVADYAEAMAAGEKFPPVVLFHDGTDYFMADGFHRILAAVRTGATEILADVRKGTRLDALAHALGANKTNGLRRTNADKRHCVELALKEFADWSDRKIAETCAVSPDFANRIHEQQVSLKDTCSDSAQSEPTTRTGKDGKRYPAKRESASTSDTKQESETTHKTTRQCIGMMHAENAVRQLQKISSEDEEKEKALIHVINWCKRELREMKIA